MPISGNVYVQKSSPHYPTMLAAYTAYLQQHDISSPITLNQQMAIWDEVCTAGSEASNGGVCPQAMTQHLWNIFSSAGVLNVNYTYAHEVVPGMAIVVGAAFASTGGATELMPIRDVNGYLRDATGRFASDPNAMVEDTSNEPHGNSFASSRVAYL